MLNPMDTMPDKSYMYDFNNLKQNYEEMESSGNGATVQRTLFSRLQFKWVYWVFQFDVQRG